MSLIHSIAFSMLKKGKTEFDKNDIPDYAKRRSKEIQSSAPHGVNEEFLMKQAVNPFLPLNTYIPDGEPHVFGDRVYLFGSHDREGGKTFCELGYEIWSAPVDDLASWTNNGINYVASQDPLSKTSGREYLFAPDCVRGNDGKFYLYYCLSGKNGKGGYFGPVSVAVCDTPDGKYEFYGHVRYENGSLCHDSVPFDPAVINDGGVIRLYYGTQYPFDNTPFPIKNILRRVQKGMFNHTVKQIKKGVMGAVCCTLKDDMLTIDEPPKLIKIKGVQSNKMHLISKNGHYFSGLDFYEGASIRKIDDKYYFIYSSANNHELCYAIGDRADEYEFKGTIISTGDVGFNGRTEKNRLNHTGTTHGSIEKINGKWYVFYHRQTHGSDYSRQACAEIINIEKDGTIPQAEVTSCGLNGGDIIGEGSFPAAICCNLSNGKMPHGGNKKFRNIPMVTSENGELFIKGLKKPSFAAYKYFDLSKTAAMAITCRGSGKLRISYGNTDCSIDICSGGWMQYSVSVNGGKHSVLKFITERGSIDIKDFTLQGGE